MPDPLPRSLQQVVLRAPMRRRVYEAVVATPGTHLRRLSRELGIALGSVEHHVRILEEHGLLFCIRRARRRTVYASGQVTSEDAVVVHTLRKTGWAKMVHALLQAGACGVAALAQRLDIPATTASYHARRLRDAGILTSARIGRETVYAVRDPQRVHRVVTALRLEATGATPDRAFQGVLDRSRIGAPGATRQTTTTAAASIDDEPDDRRTVDDQVCATTA